MQLQGFECHFINIKLERCLGDERTNIYVCSIISVDLHNLWNAQANLGIPRMCGIL